MSFSGFLNLRKPRGITSHDAVAAVRRLAGVKTGHAGTLDPAAEGVLVICLGKGARLASFAAEAEKEYEAQVLFGVATDTLDAEGEVTGRADASGLTEEAVRAALPEFVGEIMQRPPEFSAVKVAGRRAYEMARGGEQVVLPERGVVVHEMGLVGFTSGEQALAMVRVRCGKGFYVRSLARDLGARLGLPAHLAGLVRTRVGVFRIAESASLDEVEAAARGGVLGRLLAPLEAPLEHLARVELSDAEAGQVRHGRTVARAGLSAQGTVRVYDGQGGLIALAKVEAGGRLRPSVVLAEE